MDSRPQPAGMTERAQHAAPLQKICVIRGLVFPVLPRVPRGETALKSVEDGHGLEFFLEELEELCCGGAVDEAVVE